MVWPADGSTQSSRYTEISAIFREAMNAATISPLNFTLTDSRGNPILGNVFYDPTTWQATFIPLEALNFNQAYTATLSGAIQDSLGQELGSDYTWTFRVKGGPPVLYMPLVLRGY